MKLLQDHFENDTSLALKSHKESFMRSFKVRFVSRESPPFLRKNIITHTQSNITQNTTSALSTELRYQNASRARRIMNMSNSKHHNDGFESPSNRLIAFANVRTRSAKMSPTSSMNSGVDEFEN